MNIWIDADSCPAKIRAIIVRAAKRNRITAFFVANRHIPLTGNGGSRYCRQCVVPQTKGSADDYIESHLKSNDLAVSRDIPLAARLLAKGAVVINDRGYHFTTENIKERLSWRDAMYHLRQDYPDIAVKNCTITAGEIKKFADTFDKQLNLCIRNAACSQSKIT